MIPLLHIHPMVVHLPIVLLMAAVVLGVVVAAWGDTLTPCWCLSRVSAATLSLSALDAAPTAAPGALAADGAAAGFPEAVFATRKTLGAVFPCLAPVAGRSPWPASRASGS